jgi:DNA-binding transcriptional LysR family regulator
MDVRRLGLFLAVVDHGTFTQAAAASYVSQPGLSQAVRALEAELGIALFERVARGVRLTPAGSALVPHARRVVRDVEAGRAAVAAVAGLVEGRVDLACLPTLAVDPAAPIVGTFRARYPGVHVVLAGPADPADLLSMVLNGAVELGITEAGDAMGSAVVHSLGDQDLVAVLPPGTPVPPRPLTLVELGRHPLVVTPPGTSSRAVLDESLAAAGVTPRIAVETAVRDAVIPLVLAGAGATVLPNALAASAAALGAVVATTRPRLRRSVVLVHRDAELAPAAAALRDMAVAGRPRRTGAFGKA